MYRSVSNLCCDTTLAVKPAPQRGIPEQFQKSDILVSSKMSISSEWLLGFWELSVYVGEKYSMKSDYSNSIVSEEKIKHSYSMSKSTARKVDYWS